MRPKRRVNFWRVEEEKKLPLTLLTGKGPLGFNPTAKFIWELLDGKHTFEEILNLLAKEYPDTERGIIEKDLIQILQELEKEGLVILNYDPLQPNLGLD